MTRAATDVMHDAILAAVLDAVAALKAASGGLPNNLLRQIGAIHANTTFADLPKEVQDAIAASTRAAFQKLLKEGYNVSSGSAPPPRPAHIPRREPGGRPPPRHGGGERKPGGDRPRGPRPGGGGKPGGGPRPPRRGGPKPG
jgi:hypothetical protein